MRKVCRIPMSARSLIAATALVALNMWVPDPAQAAAAPENGAPPAASGDGDCTIEVVVQTTPAFTERLPCHYSNHPVFKSDRLTWSTPRNTVSLSTGKRTADSATVAVNDAKIPYIDGNGNTVTMPKAGRVYQLNSASKSGWSAVVDVFTTPNDPFPVECHGGYHGGTVPPIPYVTGSDLQLTWATVGNAGDVVHGTAQAVLSCEKINMRGPRTPLGTIGKAVVKF
jgi:hypothetical protein